MITVSIELRADGITDLILTAICDSMADLDRVSDDILDWSFGASPGGGEARIRIDHRGREPSWAADRAREIVLTAISAMSGSFGSDPHPETRVSAELIDV